MKVSTDCEDDFKSTSITVPPTYTYNTTQHSAKRTLYRSNLHLKDVCQPLAHMQPQSRNLPSSRLPSMVGCTPNQQVLQHHPPPHPTKTASYPAAHARLLHPRPQFIIEAMCIPLACSAQYPTVEPAGSTSPHRLHSKYTIVSPSAASTLGFASTRSSPSRCRRTFSVRQIMPKM